jgi:flagellar hook-length control protein FliK
MQPTVATNAGTSAPKTIAARAASGPGAAKSKATALPVVATPATEPAIDASDLQSLSDAPGQSEARSEVASDEAVSAKGSDSDPSTSTPAAASATVPESIAQALAGLVHQLLVKDSRTESASVSNSAVTADATALATVAGVSAGVARTAVAAASVAQLLLGKSSLDSDASADPDDGIAAADSSAPGAASAAALAVAAATQPAAATAIPERVITVPVQSSQWPQALGTEIRWLTSQNIQSAVLRLSPDHLGPVQVNISVNASHVSVSFGAAHPDTRAALEQAMPRLRDMLSGAGLTLGEATVQQQSRQASQNSNPAARSLLTGADTDAQPASAVMWRSGLVDEYA